MKNCYTFLFTFFCLTSLFSQEKKTFELTGTVLSDSIAIENVHIINKTSLKGAFTNKNGVFILPVKVGDSLFVSHINMSSKTVIISIAEMVTKQISVNIYSKTHTLTEITLKKRRPFFYADTDIMPHSMVNSTTLKLPYANVKQKPENKNVLRPESGLAVNLVSLINSFNGKRKKAKELKNAKKRDKKFDKLRSQFQDSFFYVDLKIRDGYINKFLEHCIKEGIYSYREKDNIIQLTNYLIQKSKVYPHKQIDNDTLLSKQ
jgi:hypothetical protein